MQRKILEIPVLGKLYYLLVNGSPVAKMLIILSLWLIVPLGGWVVLFWLTHKFYKWLRKSSNTQRRKEPLKERLLDWFFTIIVIGIWLFGKLFPSREVNTPSKD